MAKDRHWSLALEQSGRDLRQWTSQREQAAAQIERRQRCAIRRRTGHRGRVSGWVLADHGCPSEELTYETKFDATSPSEVGLSNPYQGLSGSGARFSGPVRIGQSSVDPACQFDDGPEAFELLDQGGMRSDASLASPFGPLRRNPGGCCVLTASKTRRMSYDEPREVSGVPASRRAAFVASPLGGRS